MLVSLLFGVGFVALLSLPHIHNAEETGMTMATAPSKMTQATQPARASAPWQSLRNQYLPMQASKPWQPSWAGQQFMQARQPMQQVSALTSPDQPDYSTYPVTNAQSQLEQSYQQGRRDAIAALFALGVAAVTNQATAAEQSYNVYKGQAPAEEALPKAEDYTRYDSVTVKKGAAPSERAAKAAAQPKAGSVEAPAWALPAAGVGVIGLTAAIPALLSPGETAYNAQRANEGKFARGTSKATEKNRQALRQAGKKKWFGDTNVQDRKPLPGSKKTTSKKGGIFR
jgi:hypothetical protein